MIYLKSGGAWINKPYAEKLFDRMNDSLKKNCTNFDPNAKTNDKDCVDSIFNGIGNKCCGSDCNNKAKYKVSGYYSCGYCLGGIVSDYGDNGQEIITI